MDGTDGYGAKAVFEPVFREAGLPKEMPTDNGSSFAAARSRLGLTRVMAGWVQLGIRLPCASNPTIPSRTAPTSPFGDPS